MGGSSSGKEPNIAADNLFAQDVIELLYSFGEGTIHGLVDGLKTFYAGGTPIISKSDDSLNFQDFAISFRQGYGDDQPIYLLMGGESSNLESATGQTLPFNVVRSFTTEEQYRGKIHFIDLRLAVQRLVTGNSKGDQTENTLVLQIRYRKSEATEWTYVTKTISDQYNDKMIVRSLRNKALSLGLDYDAMSVEDQREFADTYINIILPEGSPVDNANPLDSFLADSESYVQDQIQQQQSSTRYDDRGSFNVDRVRSVALSVFNSRKNYLNNILGAGYNAADLVTKLYTIYGKTTTGYIREISIPMPDNPDDDWVIEVLNVTKDLTPEEAKYSARDVAIETIAVVTDNLRTYPDTVMCQIIAQSTDRFPTIPDFYGDFYGILCDIPTNYNPFNHTYSGIWSGEYKKGWTNNPVWIIREMLMNPSWGVRKYQLNTEINNSNFYAAAQYCDEFLLDFEGNQSPRHTFNEVFTDYRAIRETIKYVAGTFHATLRELDGVYSLYIDNKKQSNFFICPENITQAGFVYSKSDLASRYNLMRVTFKSKKMGYDEDRRIIVDQASINKNGVIEYGFQAMGVTNLTEAIRQGAYMMLTNRDENIYVKFQSPRLGHLVNLYDNFYIADKYTGWGMSARIHGYNAGSRTIELRDPIILLEGSNKYKVTFHTPYGLTSKMCETVDAYTLKLVLNVEGIGEDGEPLYSAVSAEHNPDAEWLVDETPIMIEGGAYGAAKSFRVLSIVESEDSSVPQGEVFEFSGAIISPSKYTILDNITEEETLGLTFQTEEGEDKTIVNRPKRVENVNVYMKDFIGSNGAPMYAMNFDPSDTAASYKIRWVNGNTKEAHETVFYSNEGTLAPAFDITTPAVSFSVTPVTADGIEGETTVLSRLAIQFELINDNNLPNLISVTNSAGHLTFTWEEEPEDMFEYEKLLVYITTPEGRTAVEQPKGITSYSIPFLGAGISSIQLGYIINDPETGYLRVLNKLWKYESDLTITLNELTLISYETKYKNLYGVDAPTGEGFPEIALQVPEAFVLGIFTGLQLKYKVEFETTTPDVYETIPDSWVYSEIGVFGVRIYGLVSKPYGRKFRVRTETSVNSSPSPWFVQEITAPLDIDPSAFDPEQTYLDNAT